MISLIALTTCLGCPGITSSDAASTTYSAAFSTQFVESSKYVGGVTLNCQNTYNLIGTVTVVVRSSSESSVVGDGKVNAQENWVSVSGSGCLAGPSRSTTGDWTADLAGPASQFGFTVQRVGSESFVITTAYTFAGVLSGNSVTGTIRLTQTGRGITGGTVVSSSDGSASVAVTLR